MRSIVVIRNASRWLAYIKGTKQLKRLSQHDGEYGRKISGSLKRTRGLAGVAAAAVVVLLALGCSSTSHADKSASQPTAGSAGSSASTAAGGTSQVAAAQAAVRTAEGPITSIPTLAPLKSPPSAGKTFVWMQCDLTDCQNQVNAAQAAVRAVGWHLKTLSFSEGNPQSLVSGLLRALQYHPIAVGVAGMNEAQFSAVIPAYSKAGVVIVNSFSDGAPTGPIITNFNGTETEVVQAQMLSNWFIADSGGKGKVLSVDVSGIAGLTRFDNTFVSFTKSHCANCSVTTLPLSYDDALGGKVTGAVVAQLEKDRSLGYVVFSEGAFSGGLPAALAAAGLQHRVKILGEAATVTDLADIKNGSESAWTQHNEYVDVWLQVDAVLRHAEGMSLEPTLLTQPRLLATGMDFPVEANLNEPADYASQFEKLWHVG